MHVLRTLCLAASLLLTSTLPLYASDIIVDDEAGCLAIGGHLSYGTHCEVPGRLVVPSGTRVVLDRGFSLTVGGATIIDGVLETNGSFNPAELTNRGTLITSGLTVNTGFLINEATWLNRGWLHPHSDVENRGDFVNDGFFETCTGAFHNHGFWHNTRTFANWGWGVWNYGITVNDGTYYNPDDDMYRFNNLGAFENNGTFENWGIADGWCGSVFYGDGDVIGIPIEGSSCAPANLAEKLAGVVLDLGPARDAVLTKDDTLTLWSLPARAGKHLEFGDAANAAAAIQSFLTEVELLGTTLPPHLGRALVAWAEEILALIGSLAGGAS